MTAAPRKFEVRFFALLREQAGCSSLEVESAANDATALYGELQQRLPGLVFPARLLRVSLNERYTEMSAPLGPGDRIVFIPPVAGG